MLLRAGGLKPLAMVFLMVGFAAGGALSGAYAEELSLLKTIPLEITGYVDARDLPQALQSSGQVIGILDKSRNIALHMEILRRAFHELSLAEHEKFIQALHDRHRQIPDDTFRYFDHGYAQLLFRGNKIGLYFLRKADDQLKNQFTSLAYAMAQAEIDLNDEMASPEILTRRKQDVTYKLQDAVTRDAEAPLPGFWPSFVQILDKLAPLTAYADFIETDFTQTYVPYGNSGLPGAVPKPDEDDEPAGETTGDGNGKTPDQATPPMKAPVSCSPATDAASLNFGSLFRSLSVDLDGDGVTEALHFFYTDQDNWYRVALVNRNNQVLADLRSPVAPYIVEDLDGDGVSELVIRKFKADRLHPVEVYRFDQCAYKLDETVSGYFK